MLKSFLVVFRFFVFWLLFFLLERIVFLCYFPEKLDNVSVFEFVSTLAYGIRLDASMAGYISIIPLLIFILQWLIPGLKIKRSLARKYVVILILLFSFITIVNFNIYREWGTKINYRALDFAFNSTREAVASSSSSPVFASFFIFFVLVFISFYLSSKVIDYDKPDKSIAGWKKIIGSMLFLALTFLIIRGGLGASPINQSMAYFSDKPFLNHAAINTEWNLTQDLLNNKFDNHNPYKYFPEKQAAKLVDELYPESSGNSTPILNTTKPNIVFILLESFTADIVESMGGEQEVAPGMEQLIKEGLFFNNIYASGDRTDKGLVAVLSAFPAQATRSIMKLNDKQEKLPAISKTLLANGYNTSFYYGGQSEFFNIKSYILGHGYKKIVDQSDFDKNDLSSWGAFDHHVFEKNAEEMDVVVQPFFSTILTLSNHEPFQLPGKAHFPGETTEQKFRSTAFYTDSSLHAYINSVKNKNWYKNTLFVIVADHGHRLPKNTSENYNPNRFRIPLLFMGGALKPELHGKTINKIGNQTDLAATILNQLGISHEEYKWSNDLLNPTTPAFSFFNWDNGFGFATEKQVISFDNVGKNIIYRKNPENLQEDERSLNYGKAYMQQVFQTYLTY